MKWHLILTALMQGFNFLMISDAFGQETNGNISGIILSDSGKPVQGATILLTNESTQKQYQTISSENGRYHFIFLKPGGPYTIQVSHILYQQAQKNNLHVGLQSNNDLFKEGSNPLDFILPLKVKTLSEVFIIPANLQKMRPGIETSIDLNMIEKMPAINRNFQDYLRLVPQARVTGDGIISLAGQNNRFNAFFIDGASVTDILGLAPSGTNGGQTGSAPISIEAIDDIKVLIAPYDVQYSNFTGGSIQAITKSGSNQQKASAWYFFRNEQMAGRSPIPIEKQDNPGIFHRPKLPDFFNQTIGIWNSGPLIKNRLFYFVLIEHQSETRPIQSNLSSYSGNSGIGQLEKLQDFLKSTYNYNAGSLSESSDNFEVNRLNLKLDWNPGARDQFMLSYRLNHAWRTAPRFLTGTRTIAFANTGFKLPANTNSGSLEWKHSFKNNFQNRLLITYTNQKDDRTWLGSAFPRVTVMDGAGSIEFGSDAASALSLFKAGEWNLLNIFSLSRKKSVISYGLDLNQTRIDDININSYFGNYTFASLNDFLTNKSPTSYVRSYSNIDEPRGDQTKAGAYYKTFRMGIFISDEIRFSKSLKLNAGLRLDRIAFPNASAVDGFFNDTALPIIEGFYSLEGTKTGQKPSAHWQLSPRIGISKAFEKSQLLLRGGAGIFTGHIVNIWASNFYNQGVKRIELISPNSGLKFEPDPNNQPTADDFTSNVTIAKTDLNLISRKFKFPVVFRSSLSIDKRIGKYWTIGLEGVLTKNIHETSFKNVNILPPIGQSSLPDQRDIYSTGTRTRQIPLAADGSNPYTQVTLLSNNKQKKGTAASISAVISQNSKYFTLEASYTYGKSQVLFEIAENTNMSLQWRSIETVNGRNKTNLSISDNDLRHRIAMMLSKIFYTKTGKASTLFTLMYNGQSGSPFSYVYQRSIVNDVSNQENNDLIYIPTTSELAKMSFIPFTQGSVIVTPEIQKQALNEFISKDQYLKKNRGEFASRNGARLPFVHTLDMRIQQNIYFNAGKRKLKSMVIFDLFNLLNFFNKDWGIQYLMPGDNFRLIRIAGLSQNAALIPSYQYTPLQGDPYTVQGSTVPGKSSRWICQLGFRIELR